MQNVLSKLAATYSALSDWFFSLGPVEMGGVVVVTLGLLAGIVQAIVAVFERLDRRKLDGFYKDGRRFRASRINYSLFRNHRTLSEYAARDIDAELVRRISEGENLILIGTPLRGKTRTMAECVRQLERTDCIIAKPADYVGSIRFPKKRRFATRHLLLLDDIHEFFRPPYNATHLISAAWDNGFTVVGNCRNTAEWQVVANAYDTIAKHFSILELPSPSDEEVRAALEANDLEELPEHFDQENIGTIFVDLDTAREWYNNATDRQRTILCAIKEAAILGLSGPGNDVKLEHVRILGEKGHGLIIDANAFTDEIQWAKAHAFIDKDDTSDRIRPKDVVFARVVKPGIVLADVIENGLNAGFTPEQIGFEGMLYSAADEATARRILNEMRRRNITVGVAEYNQLLGKQSGLNHAIAVYDEMLAHDVSPNLETYYRLSYFSVEHEGILDESGVRVVEAAVSYFDSISGEHLDNELFWGVWGSLLGDLARAKGDDEELFREAFDKYRRATEIKPDFHEAFYNWGNALADLAGAKGNDEGLFREAFDKYRRATEIKPDLHEAFYNWGNALADLAGAKGNDEGLFREAFDKYRRATEIKPDKHVAFSNWGLALSDLARAKGNDEELFREAFDKYRRATEIKPDKHKAFYNWGSALDDLARAKGNDEGLGVEAIEKFETARQLRPDLFNDDYTIREQ